MENNQQLTRCFIAFDFKDSDKEYIAKLQSDYKSLKPARISYTKSEQFHMTTSFLGDISNEKVNQVIDILKNTKIENEIDFKFSRVDYFPSERKPRTIILKAHTEDYVRETIERLDLKLAAIGIIRDKKWIPHLTLGRSKELFEIPKFIMSAFSARAISLTLYSSVLQREGAIHEKLYSIYLK